MREFERMQKQGRRLEKFVKWFIAFVFIMIVISWIGYGVVAMYFINNPDSIGNWFSELIKGFSE